MTKKELMIKAHEMTREIKNEYPEIDYKFQLGLCLAYLQEKGKMVELKGSEKQIKWAESIREKVLEIAKKNKFKHVIELVNNKDDAKYWIENFKMMTANYKTDFEKYKSILSLDFHIQCEKEREAEEAEMREWRRRKKEREEYEVI